MEIKPPETTIYRALFVSLIIICIILIYSMDVVPITGWSSTMNKQSEFETILNHTNLQLSSQTIKNINKSTVYADCLIFQIGFNKAGTTALYKFFMANSITGVHYGYPGKRGITLSQIMFDRYIKNKSVLPTDIVNNYRFFADFDVYIHPETHGLSIKFLNDSYQFGKYKHWFEVLTKQYPNSLYILNIRAMNHWIRSRFRFCWHGCIVHKLQQLMPETFHSNIDIVYAWKQLWFKYICKCLEYFIEGDIMDRLIIFDIENDSFEKLTIYFEKYGVKLNASLMMNDQRFRHETHIKNRNTAQLFKRWDNITKYYPEFRDDNQTLNEVDKIAKKCHIERQILDTY